MNTISQEVVVATTPTLTDERQLTQEVTDIEFQAEALVVENDDDYAIAGEFGKNLKRKAAQVAEFFKPMKDSAYQAHRAVCEREKAVLKPLQNAERTIKKTMADYITEKERQRREQEEALRRAAEAERERKLAEAAALEAEGKSDDAEAAVMEAVVMDDASRMALRKDADAAPKMTGVSSSKDWEIVSVDDASVPVDVAGVVIRPVDVGAVMRLVRASKGKINIPGISYREVTKMSFRR